MKEISASSASGKIGKSELIKKEFFGNLFGAAEIDAEAKSQLVEAIRGVP